MRRVEYLQNFTQLMTVTYNDNDEHKYNLSSVSDADRRTPTRGKRIMLETKFTEFPALSTDPRVGIFQSALETDD